MATLKAISVLFSGWYTDVARRRGWVRRTITIRKFNTFLGLVVPAAALVAAGYVGNSSTVPAVALFVVSAGFNTFTVAGCKARLTSMNEKKSLQNYVVKKDLGRIRQNS